MFSGGLSCPNWISTFQIGWPQKFPNFQRIPHFRTQPNFLSVGIHTLKKRRQFRFGVCSDILQSEWYFSSNGELILVTWYHRLVIMTSLILCSLPSGATSPLSNKQKIHDVIMTSRSTTWPVIVPHYWMFICRMCVLIRSKVLAGHSRDSKAANERKVCSFPQNYIYTNSKISLRKKCDLE